MRVNNFYTKLLVIPLLLTVSLVIYAANNYSIESVQPSLSNTHTSSWSNKQLQSIILKMDNRLSRDKSDHEASLFKSMLLFKSGAMQKALSEIEQLSHRAPDFHLAHLVRGDILMSQHGKVSDIGMTPILTQLDNKNLQNLQQLRAEAEARLKAMIEIELGNKVPLQLLGMGESIETAILVEKKFNRLYVYSRTSENKPPRLIRDYYVSTGKKTGDKQVRGDLRTPEGVYFVTTWIPDAKLPPKYGVGAFPVNYPNPLDRKLGKTGDGIWLHGTDPSFYSRPPLDSEGCVVLPNIDLDGLKSQITPGRTPVIITETANWIKPAQWQRQRKDILTTLEQWRRDWESLDVNKYLSHYARDFWSGRHDYKSWVNRKKTISQHKTYQRVNLSDISLFSYALTQGEKSPLIVVRFRQQYESNNYSGDIQKQVYLQKKGRKWQILYEGS